MEKKDIVLIGGSAGSIDVLFYILPKLPKEFSIPVVIILHREPTHESHLAELFQMKSKIRVLEVDDKMKIEKNTVYIAPAKYHLLLEPDYTFSLDTSEKVKYTRPSIDVSFISAVDVYKSHIIGIILSGSNDDGAEGMKR